VNFIERLVAKRIVKRIAKGIEMAGWKTKTAGIAAILSGGGTAISSIVNGDFSGAWQGWLLLVAPARRGLGLGHKLDKLTGAVKSGPPAGRG